MRSGDSYRTPAREGRAELKERGSRFLALVFPVSQEASVEQILAEVKARHRDATHHCWAWRWGWPPSERGSDGGEPAGTAAQPMLMVLRGARLSDTLAIVVRWFGGTKLGKGGLARAYAGALKSALAELPIRRRVLSTRLVVVGAHEALGGVRRLLQRRGVRLVEESYGTEFRLVLDVALEARADFEEALAPLPVHIL